MKFSNKLLFTLSLFCCVTLIFSNKIHAQGCSDAGLCTIDGFKPSINDKGQSKANKGAMRFGIGFGQADFDINVLNSYISYVRNLSDKWGIEAKLSGISQSGNDLSNAGLSDVFLNTTFRAGKNIRLFLGTKIPLTNAGKSKDGIALPMDYQSSLGTVDIMAGIGYDVKDFQFMLGLQQPVMRENSNNFLSSAFPSNSILSQFPSTRRFIRKSDLLLRASYVWNLSDKWNITPAVLGIYHTGDDEYTNTLAQKIRIDGSQGLTCNLNLFADYVLNVKSKFQLQLAAPVLVRDTRPDGLTRKWVAGIEYQLAF